MVAAKTGGPEALRLQSERVNPLAAQPQAARPGRDTIGTEPAIAAQISISYASTDQAVADQVYVALENAGITARIAPRVGYGSYCENAPEGKSEPVEADRPMKPKA
jgi:hypothetical protein